MSELVFSALSIKLDSRKFVMVVISFGDRLIYFYNQKIKEILMSFIPINNTVCNNKSKSNNLYNLNREKSNTIKKSDSNVQKVFHQQS